MPAANRNSRHQFQPNDRDIMNGGLDAFCSYPRNLASIIYASRMLSTFFG
jgi:hypothetical protein